MVIFVFGAGSVTVEFSRGAARTTWLAAGSRGVAFAEKLAVGAAVGAGLVLGCTLLSVTVDAVTLGIRGVGRPDWATGLLVFCVFAAVLACAGAYVYGPRDAP
ncbi:hypothetical protein P6B95_17465 [Streptomyces atratus]|uniref:hypothetical protein n=1 Tax=Streptomyces atratus TaxID=1893 RepID=UPI001670F505|nr:hypothetical protein [Streptomyces atratus]WPW28997.1 hypothetical protein P6B95_17465 [Streptomyces atratus]GGT11153.1 hypothetical protein GCM10010207_07390 [Streptomyces atratus]